MKHPMCTRGPTLQPAGVTPFFFTARNAVRSRHPQPSSTPQIFHFKFELQQRTSFAKLQSYSIQIFSIDLYQALHPHQMEIYSSQIPPQKSFFITAKVLLPQWFFIPFTAKQKARNCKDDMNTHIKRTRSYS
jgi:hypothetical protein